MDAVFKFWNNRPCNIKHSDKEIGTRGYFDDVEKKKYHVEPHILEFADFCRWKNKKVLEVGCGIGTASISFLRQNAVYTGIDLTDRAIEIAKKRIDVYNYNANLYVMDAEKELPPDTYDLVYSFGVIHHSIHPKRIIENVHRVLAENGEFRFMVYSKWSYKLFWMMHEYDDFEWEFGGDLNKRIAKYSEAQTGCPQTLTYTFQDIENLIHPYFKITKIWKDHIFSFDIGEYKKHNYIKSKEFESMNEADFKSMEKELGWHTMVICTRLPVDSQFSQTS